MAGSHARAQWQEAGAPLRAMAAQAVDAVLAGGASIPAALHFATRMRDRIQHFGYCQELVYGTLRYWPRLEWYASRLLEHPLPGNARDVQALILVGLYQLDILDTPPHVAVSNTVEACRDLDKTWARALVNAVLRNFVRQRDRLREGASDDAVAHHAHPRWLIDAVCRDWPQQWAVVLAANNARPPMTLRVNRLRTTRADYLEALHAAGMEASETEHSADGIRLHHPADVTILPGFTDGYASVQDEAAQLAAPLLDVHAAQRVLDACAAPGGKVAHICELQPLAGNILAVERDADRAGDLRETLARLRLPATVIVADATQPDAWWDGIPFDRILLDAPCSATGVIRRHPDIKALRRPADIPRLAIIQGELLDALWPLLAPGGKLLYVTCSILGAENSAPVQAFLDKHADAVHEQIEAPWGHALKLGRQIQPGEADMDGFFYASLVKR